MPRPRKIVVNKYLTDEEVNNLEGKWIDESYDLELNHGKRMGMVVNEIKKLCSMSIDELRGWYQNLIPILEHNKSFLESDSSQFDKLLKRI